MEGEENRSQQRWTDETERERVGVGVDGVESSQRRRRLAVRSVDETGEGDGHRPQLCWGPKSLSNGHTNKQHQVRVLPGICNFLSSSSFGLLYC